MESETRIDQMAYSLRRQGVRLTPQRLAVLRALLAGDLESSHPSAEQVYANVRRDFPTTSLATIYKTLALLKESGQIVEMGFSDDSNRYDVDTSPHVHLVCVRCKSIIDPKVSGIAQVYQQVLVNYGYKLLYQRLDFFGICPQCQSSAAAGG